MGLQTSVAGPRAACLPGFPGLKSALFVFPEATGHNMTTQRKSADQWFAEYGESHQDHANEVIHWICVPVIFYTVMGFVWSVPVPGFVSAAAPWFNWAQPVVLLVLAFYFRLSAPLALGLLGLMSFCYLLLETQRLLCPFAVWKSSLILFVAAWIGQFVGHKIEGKKPSFLQDVQFLLIGPAWLLHFVYRRLKIEY